jgi:hypothetical protein
MGFQLSYSVVSFSHTFLNFIITFNFFLLFFDQLFEPCNGLLKLILLLIFQLNCGENLFLQLFNFFFVKGDSLILLFQLHIEFSLLLLEHIILLLQLLASESGHLHLIFHQLHIFFNLFLV